MSKPTQNLNSIAAMSFAIGADGVSNEAHLLPAGEFAPTDGRELPVKAFKLDASIAANVIAMMSSRKNDTLIDYEHQSLLTKTNGKPVIAAGWFHEMEFRADGLWAINIGWTEAAKRHIKEKEYRYISAVFEFDAATGAVVDVWSIALTNTPALDGLQSLAAFSRFTLSHQTPHTGDLDMSGTDVAVLTTENAALNADVVALTTKNTALNADVVALSAERDQLKAKVKAAEDEKAAVALAAEKKAHSDLLMTALSDGRIAPAQKVWAEKQNLAALTEYLEATKPLVADGKQSAGADKPGAEGNHGLNETELAMCSSMGVEPKVFAATKQAEVERKAKASA